MPAHLMAHRAPFRRVAQRVARRCVAYARAHVDERISDVPWPFVLCALCRRRCGHLLLRVFLPDDVNVPSATRNAFAPPVATLDDACSCIRRPLSLHVLTTTRACARRRHSVLNIVIAILMDGYAGVKETVKSTVEEQIKYNVGPLIPDVMARWRASLVALVPGQRLNSAQGERERWTDERWARDLTTITDRRSKLGLTRCTHTSKTLSARFNAAFADAARADVRRALTCCTRWCRRVLTGRCDCCLWRLMVLLAAPCCRCAGMMADNIRVGQLVSELNVLSTSAGEDVAWQVQVAFQDRSFITPSNIRDPFQEPCVSPVALACPKACSARRVASLPAVRTSTLHYQVHAARSRTIKPLGLTMPRLTKLLLRLRPALGDESRVRTVAARRRIRWPKCKRRCASRKHACASS
jgi:hypothetical protein